MADIFVSYSKKDRPLAERVVSALQQAGYSVWWDDRLTPVESWDRMIEREIEAAKCVLVLWTKNSVDSEWVRIEANFAKNARPAKLVQARFDKSELPIAFSLTQCADVFDARLEPSRNREWARVLGWLGLFATPAAPAPAAPPAAKPASFDDLAAAPGARPAPVAAKADPGFANTLWILIVALTLGIGAAVWLSESGRLDLAQYPLALFAAGGLWAAGRVRWRGALGVLALVLTLPWARDSFVAMAGGQILWSPLGLMVFAGALYALLVWSLVAMTGVRTDRVFWVWAGLGAALVLLFSNIGFEYWSALVSACVALAAMALLARHQPVENALVFGKIPLPLALWTILLTPSVLLLSYTHREAWPFNDEIGEAIGIALIFLGCATPTLALLMGVGRLRWAGAFGLVFAFVAAIAGIAALSSFVSYELRSYVLMAELCGVFILFTMLYGPRPRQPVRFGPSLLLAAFGVAVAGSMGFDLGGMLFLSGVMSAIPIIMLYDHTPLNRWAFWQKPKPA
jgi:hypothetical protein